MKIEIHIEVDFSLPYPYTFDMDIETNEPGNNDIGYDDASSGKNGLINIVVKQLQKVLPNEST